MSDDAEDEHVVIGVDDGDAVWDVSLVLRTSFDDHEDELELEVDHDPADSEQEADPEEEYEDEGELHSHTPGSLPICSLRLI